MVNDLSYFARTARISWSPGKSSLAKRKTKTLGWLGVLIKSTLMLMTTPLSAMILMFAVLKFIK